MSLFALVTKVQFELRSLKGHQHAAKLVPGDVSTIDNEKRQAAILGIIPLNPALHDLVVRDLQSVLAIGEMFDGQGAADLFDQSPKQHP